MRIVSGKYGGRKLIVPSGRDIRPTTDKVRGAIFNALIARGMVDGAHVLDLFCGTGALGLEALSRGASHCTFIDKSRKSIDITKENAKALGADNDTKFMVSDAGFLPVRGDGIPPASLVFLDPPYGQDLAVPALENMRGWITDDAFIVLEVEKRFSGVIPAPYNVVNEKKYGDTKVLFLRLQNPAINQCQ